jgi:hypothetical protein
LVAYEVLPSGRDCGCCGSDTAGPQLTPLLVPAQPRTDTNSSFDFTLSGAAEVAATEVVVFQRQ